VEVEIQERKELVQSQYRGLTVTRLIDTFGGNTGSRAAVSVFSRPISMPKHSRASVNLALIFFFLFLCGQDRACHTLGYVGRREAQKCYMRALCAQYMRGTSRFQHLYTGLHERLEYLMLLHTSVLA
jgi:hypothetical protein